MVRSDPLPGRAMPDNRTRFRHLQGFLAVAQHRRVRMAADALSITQPALSKTLRELEVTLGAQLFQRDKKGMILTRSGEVFLQHAAESVASLRRGVDSIRMAVSKGGYGVVAGALPNVATELMPLVVSRFKQHAPETIVRVLTGENAILLHQCPSTWSGLRSSISIQNRLSSSSGQSIRFSRRGALNPP
jgi:LysR family pca operon transcriptional activator